MGKPKPTPLFDHLTNSKFGDSSSDIAFPWDRGRLRPSYELIDGDWSDVARMISGLGQFSPAWFPDANVAMLPDTTPVWDALRLTALETGNRSQTYFTGPVLAELAPWLESPRHNPNRAAMIQEALDQKSWAKAVKIAESSSALRAVQGYICLLGKRRQLATIEVNGLSAFGTDPAKPSDTMNAIRNQIGVRAHGLAKKGREDFKKSGKVNVRDEVHCLMTIFHVIRTGIDSVILTADEDYVEIFQKAQWFIDTHYRAWLAAKMVADGLFGQPEKVVNETYGLFEGPLSLYRRHSNHLMEVLPSSYQSAHVRVVYVASDKKIHHLGFPFERGMGAMLETRSKTNGRCTDLFEQQNIHVDLGPLNPDLGGLFLGIGHDCGLLETIDDGGEEIFLSKLDIEHAINCQERHMPL